MEARSPKSVMGIGKIKKAGGLVRLEGFQKELAGRGGGGDEGWVR